MANKERIENVLRLRQGREHQMYDVQLMDASSPGRDAMRESRVWPICDVQGAYATQADVRTAFKLAPEATDRNQKAR